jgi:predicted nucleotidyltransferase
MRSPNTRQSHRRFPLTRLMGDSGNLRVLRSLLAYEGPQSSTQLARDSALTLAGVAKVLDSLVTQGAVQILGGGRSRLFQAVTSHPFVTELKAVFAHERAQWEGFLSGLRQLFQGDGGVKAAWLYGSVARGEDTPESDVDLAVLVEDEPAAERIRQALHGIEASLHAHFSVITLTADTLPSVKRTWWSEVLRDGRTLKGPDPAHAQAGARRRYAR